MTVVESLMRYPVKGLSGERLEKVQLNAGQGFPFDRLFGFARPNSGFDINNPKPLQKTKFYMLARDEQLVLLDTGYNPDTGSLIIRSPEKESEFDIHSDHGKQSASRFLQHYLNLPEEEIPELFDAAPHRFTDVSVDSEAMMNAVSIINVDSVRAFSDAIAQPVDPGRFRGNILISGCEPFSELERVDQEITIGDVQLKIVQRTRRCPATEVNLETGERDIKTPRLLREHFGHMDMGVYAEVTSGGVLQPGDSVKFST